LLAINSLPAADEPRSPAASFHPSFLGIVVAKRKRKEKKRSMYYRKGKEKGQGITGKGKIKKE